jgi:hypothetical protein
MGWPSHRGCTGPWGVDDQYFSVDVGSEREAIRLARRNGQDGEDDYVRAGGPGWDDPLQMRSFTACPGRFTGRMSRIGRWSWRSLLSTVRVLVRAIRLGLPSGSSELVACRTRLSTTRGLEACRLPGVQAVRRSDGQALRRSGAQAVLAFASSLTAVISAGGIYRLSTQHGHARRHHSLLPRPRDLTSRHSYVPEAQEPRSLLVQSRSGSRHDRYDPQA